VEKIFGILLVYKPYFTIFTSRPHFCLQWNYSCFTPAVIWLYGLGVLVS